MLSFLAAMLADPINIDRHSTKEGHHRTSRSQFSTARKKTLM